MPGPRRQSAREGSSAAECPRWTRQGARSDFGICLIFFQTYFISSASESSVPSLLGVGRRKDGDTPRDRKATAGGPVVVAPEPQLAGRPVAPSRTGPGAAWSQAGAWFGQNSLRTGVGALSSTFSSVSRRPRWWGFGGGRVTRVAGPLGRGVNRDTKSQLRRNSRPREAAGKSCYFELPRHHSC